MDMQKMTIYLMVENEETRESMRIDGSFAVFKSFLDSFVDPKTADALPVNIHPIQPAEGAAA